jgi:hypothetical protein
MSHDVSHIANAEFNGLYPMYLLFRKAGQRSRP